MAAVLVLPVLLIGLDIGLEGVLVTLLPLRWANFSVFVDILEGLNESEDLVNVSSDWQVVVGGVSEDSLAINYESGSKKLARAVPGIKGISPRKKRSFTWW